MNNPHDPVSQFRSNLKNWEMVAKYGPDFAEAPARILEKQEIIKPVARLRRSKNHSVKKGKNLGKDRFPTHKVKLSIDNLEQENS